MKDKMKRYLKMAALLLLAACDEGDIAENDYKVNDTGRTVKLTARVEGLSTWETQNSHVALAAFATTSQYAIMQKAIPSGTRDGDMVELVVSNISSEVNTIELAVTNSLRKRIVTLETLRMSDYEGYGPRDTIRMELGTLDLSRFGCLQYGVFDKACIQCHGGNGRSAGNLNLTQGLAYANLVDMASTQKEGAWRVKSGNADESLVCQILDEGGENLLNYNHTEVLSSLFKENLQEVKSLIRDWINGI